MVYTLPVIKTGLIQSSNLAEEIWYASYPQYTTVPKRTSGLWRVATLIRAAWC